MDRLFAEELGRTPPDSPPPLAQQQQQPHEHHHHHHQQQQQQTVDADAVHLQHVRIHIPEAADPHPQHAPCNHPLHHAWMQHAAKAGSHPAHASATPEFAAQCPQCAQHQFTMINAERRRSRSQQRKAEGDAAAANDIAAATAEAEAALAVQERAAAVAAAESEAACDKTLETEAEAESPKPNNLGLLLLAWSSGLLAVAICGGGAAMLIDDNHALLISEGGCNQLFLWSILFILFEGMYLILLILNAFNYAESNFHAKRAKTSFLLIVLLMSVGMFVWGTIIINKVTCPEVEHKLLWVYFRVLYWMIVGIWSLVLLALTAPVALFLAFKIYTDRKPS